MPKCPFGVHDSGRYILPVSRKTILFSCRTDRSQQSSIFIILDFMKNGKSHILLPANEVCEGYVFTGVSVCPQGVSVRGVSVWGGLCTGGLCPGGFLSRGSLCRGSLYGGSLSGRPPIQLHAGVLVCILVNL